MKFYGKCAAAAAAVLMFSAAAWAFPNEPAGFNGIAWGSRWEGMSDQFREAPQAPSGGKYYYERIFGGSEWLGYPLNTLYYAFRDDGRFWGVEGQVDDRSSSYADVLHYAVRRYGRPQYGTTNNGYQKASWYGRDVNIVLAKTYRGWRFTIGWRGPRVAPLSPPPHHNRRPEYSPPPPPGARPGYGPPPPPLRRPGTDLLPLGRALNTGRLRRITSEPLSARRTLPPLLRFGGIVILRDDCA